MAQITALPQDLRILNDQLRRVELIDTRLNRVETALGVTNSNIPTVPVQSVFGRTGAVVATSGDYSFSLISGTVNLATQTSGNLAVSHLNSGTSAGNTNFWRGDGTWSNILTSDFAIGGNCFTTGDCIPDMFTGRAGTGGAGSNNFNIEWRPGTAEVHLWIDVTDMGPIVFSDGMGGFTWTPSDRRIKDDFTDFPDALDALLALKPTQFSFKSDPSKGLHKGFIADEVQRIIPSAVRGSKDALNAAGNPMPQAINQMELVAVLVKAVQELSAEVRTLQQLNGIEVLDSRVTTI